MNILFWNVDTQKDFMDKDGKLYVQGAEEIKPILKAITDLAKQYKIQVVNTQDFHTPNSEELSEKPDFVTSFPPHCMEDTDGVEFIEETNPETPHIVGYGEDKHTVNKIFETKNLVIRKDKFDVFTGNHLTKQIVNIINPDIVFVYGVATNVCVNCAVLGLLKKGLKVCVVKDAIKELPNLPVQEIFDNWSKEGAIFVTYSELKIFVEILGGKHDN